ncbi:uncharacterized protein LOC128390300 [Panonychus citri]|uniref:uncharacterized protein LOC128390300 n=1 Tax=Panonychus citri TaxID=50023 RepID=UPI002307BC65|nr:uncharacterized protein LOC128390300 [Panonychus citri]
MNKQFGDTITIDCIASGYPKPKVNWKRMKDSLFDLPWSVDKGNWIITTKLISSNDEVYNIREYVHSSDVVRGKITISSGNDTVDIFYSSESEKDRLVIHNQQCIMFTFKNEWDNYLFNIDWKNTLLNHVLLTGPSILFRINGKRFTWRQGEDTNIRGFPVHSAKTTFNRNLDIIYYYKTNLDSPGILQASRLQLDGMDSSLEQTTPAENFYMDIYSITETEEELDKLVTVTPGIGCPFYLISSKSSDWLTPPELRKFSFHFTAKTTGPKESVILSEVFVNSEDQTVNLKTTEQGITTEYLYDYNLGTIHTAQKEGQCTVSGIGSNDLGLIIHNTFTSASLLNYRDRYHFSYLGKVLIKPENEAYVWERVDYNYEFQGEKHDKSVTNHYFVQSDDAKLFKDFTLVRTTTNNYKIVNNETFELLEMITKDYTGLEEMESGEDYGGGLSLSYSDCYPDSKDRKTFAVYFDCEYEDDDHDHESDSDCLKYGENYEYEFIEKIKHDLVYRGISPTRVAKIEMVFAGKSTIALLTVLKIPNIEDSLQKVTKRLATSTISSSSRISAESIADCLYKQSGLSYEEKAIVFCNSQDVNSIICTWIESEVPIIEDENGTLCEIYYPSESFTSFKKEIHLNDVEDHFYDDPLKIYFTDGEFISFKSTEIIDVSDQQDDDINLFVLVANDENFEDVDYLSKVEDSSDLGDCYRTCAHDDVNLCETFVYCQYQDKSSCYTSNNIYANLSSQSIYDESCKVYSKSRLLDYTGVFYKEFKKPANPAINVPLEDCASKCSSSDECFSFQQCGGSCTLSGYFTDSETRESEDCDIYIPNVSRRFRFSGWKIVSEVFHTEINLNLDQCAALCHSWTNTDESCKSFNYCHQNNGKSSCSLSKYSTNDKSANSIDSGVCKSYEYKTSSK